MLFVEYLRVPFWARSYLFLFINDICNISKLLNFIIFADDTNIFCTGNNLEGTCKLISIELKKLQNWFALNKWSLNVTKTNFMVFGKKIFK